MDDENFQTNNIAECAISLNQEPQLKAYIDIPRMTEIVQSMVKDALDAFVNRDSKLARSVRERDYRVDGLNDQVFRELLTYMISDPKTITRAVHLIPRGKTSQCPGISVPAPVPIEPRNLTCEVV